ncbi:MAG: hypothetical protein IPQ23_02795 [Cytophagaceae bacterium]|nr:hypothetical protein [Cytophagaceae bacterium]
MKIAFRILFILSISASISLAQSSNYLKEEADEYFKAGRYWDAFFQYRNILKIPKYQGDASIESQISNSSRAMYLWKKTLDYKAFRKYDIAKQHMTELIVINPYDPNRGMLPRLSLEHASDLQRMAASQRTSEARADYLKRAIGLYQAALDEGLKDEMVFSLIKQCENALEKSKYDKVKQPTSYGINFEKEKKIEEERTRSVEIIKAKEKDGDSL